MVDYLSYLRSVPDKKMMASYLGISYVTLMGKLTGVSQLTEEQKKKLDAVMEDRDESLRQS